MTPREKPPRVCPECGSDRWKARDADRRYDAARRLQESAEKVARENGLLRFQLADARAQVAEIQSRMQRKITKQARVIRRMEERLRDRGQKPYEGAGFDTAPAAEYDAGQVIKDDARSEEAA